MICYWPSSPALSLYTDCRQGQAGTRDWLLRYAQHSSSYPCLAPPVLSCHIQSLIFVLNLQLFHCSSLPDLWRESYPRSCDYFSWVSVLYECRMYDWVIWLIKNSFIVLLNIKNSENQRILSVTWHYSEKVSCKRVYMLQNCIYLLIKLQRIYETIFCRKTKFKL